MNCPNCGRQLESHHKYCADCGTPVMPYNNTQVNQINSVQNQNVNPVVGQSYVQNQMIQPAMQVPNNKNKKISFTTIVISLLSIILIVIVGALVVKNNNSTSTLLKDSGTRTILIYGIGSDLESEGAMLTSDIEEIMSSNFNTSDVNIIMYTGGTKVWHTTGISAKENAIYEITPQKINKVKTYESKSMVKAETLTEFIDYVYDNYKTDLYDLILWDHGGGPLIGYGVDELHSGILSVSEINKALDNSKLIANTKFEFIGFDACLMGSIEIANEYKEEANYLIASEEVEPGYGWNYNFLKDLNKNTTSVELGKSIVSKYHSFYKAINARLKAQGEEQWDTTLAFLDLSKVDNVIKKMDESFANLSERVSTSNYSSIKEGVKDTTKFTSGAETLDLYDLSLKLGGNIVESEKLRKAIEEMVVYQENNVDGSHGLSVFYPITKLNNFSIVYSKYKDISVSSSYDLFLQNLSNIYNGKKSAASFAPEVSYENIENLVYIGIDSEVAENYRSSEYVLFIKNDLGGYTPAITSSDTVETESMVYGDKITKVITLSDDTGVSSYLTAIEFEKKDDYTIYTIDLSLKAKDSNELEKVTFYVKFTKGSDEGKVVKIVGITDNEMASRKSYELEKYETINSVIYSFEKNEHGIITDWSKSENSISNSFNASDFKFSLTNIGTDYEYMFKIDLIDDKYYVFSINK